jgi:transcriptional regulator with XRE-family HTH domain
VRNPTALQAFGTHLRRLREERKFSQQELADLSDMAKTSIQRFENAKMCATIDALVNLAKALNVPMRELMDFEIPKEKTKKT